MLQLQRAGMINSLPAEALLARMLAAIDLLGTEHDRLKKAESGEPSRSGRPKVPSRSRRWFDPNADDGAGLLGAAVAVAIGALAKRRTCTTTH
jgi:hypothetical protein